MIKINILVENHSINSEYKSSHGLSILIEYDNKNILLDVGADNNFSINAIKKNIDLAKVDYLFLPHNHMDHTRGINKFLEINHTCPVYLMDNIDSKYYIKLLFFNIPVGLKLNKKYRSRISQLSDDLVIDKKIHFLKNIVSKYQKPTFNKKLYKKINGSLINDTFEHESILVVEDNNELVIFNSCSHNGILNIIDTVKTNIPNKKIRCYIGGLHLFNPTTKINDSDEYLDYLINGLKEMDIIIYTGHCTGKYGLKYLKEKLGEKIQEINTGMELSV
jgi:7,8-dihydropterin-6-yl-methyl-4-(beta-D-ribofuranosyl)aminobenzene 5'-phosphate synthase